MSFIPKNAKQLLKNPQLMRDFALKPFGLDLPTNYKFPKKHPEYKFFQLDVVLHRPGNTKKVQPNTMVFKVKEELSKPQIKQYIQKLYGLNIQKVNTVRFMGKVRKDYLRRVKVTRSFKKAYVVTSHKIPEYLNQSIL